jgi:hypothetical protein
MMTSSLSIRKVKSQIYEHTGLDLRISTPKSSHHLEPIGAPVPIGKTFKFSPEPELVRVDTIHDRVSPVIPIRPIRLPELVPTEYDLPKIQPPFSNTETSDEGGPELDVPTTISFSISTAQERQIQTFKLAFSDFNNPESFSYIFTPTRDGKTHLSIRHISGVSRTIV